VHESDGNAVILALGGVRSGKSSYAQQLAEKSSRVTFVATAERRDDEEMHRKIERRRADRPAHWTTVEEPIALGRVVRSSGDNSDAILIDCLTLAFASPNPVICDVIHDRNKKTVTLQSSSPNVQLRVTQDPAMPVAVYAGSPFFEVAQYAGRWFLRDGYHRAYNLLRAGIFRLPAVIVRARTLEELGAVQPRFFSEAILLSEHLPFVTDFLNEALTIEYDHPIIKTLRITMEESFTSPLPIAISGDQL
jgi:hypothetical protein